MEDPTPRPGAERAVTPMSGALLTFDLADEARRLWQEHAAQSGRNAKTLVKHPDFRIVLMVVRERHRIQEHQASGRISIQTVSGHIRLRVSREGSAEAIDLPAGHVLVLESGIRHDVEALADAVVLLTIAGQ